MLPKGKLFSVTECLEGNGSMYQTGNLTSHFLNFKEQFDYYAQSRTIYFKGLFHKRIIS